MQVNMQLTRVKNRVAENFVELVAPLPMKLLSSLSLHRGKAVAFGLLDGCKVVVQESLGFP